MGGSGNYLFEIIKRLSGQGIDFIVCGGVALVLHGVERMTMDLDLSVDMAESNLKKFLRIMKELGLVPRVPVEPSILLDPRQREFIIAEKNALVFTFIDEKNPYRQVDVFLTPELSYTSLIRHAEMMLIDTIPVHVISKQKLLEMKLSISPPRDKDLFDIRALKKKIGGYDHDGGQ